MKGDRVVMCMGNTNEKIKPIADIYIGWYIVYGKTSALLRQWSDELLAKGNKTKAAVVLNVSRRVGKVFLKRSLSTGRRLNSYDYDD